MQVGLQMGPPIWYEFIYPVLKRMYGVVRDAGKYVMIHSCGDVDELFDYLIEAGVNCFNPFQPEVMDVSNLVAMEITFSHPHMMLKGMSPWKIY